MTLKISLKASTTIALALNLLACKNEIHYYPEKNLIELGNAKVQLTTKIEESHLFYKIEIIAPLNYQIPVIADSTTLISTYPINFKEKRERQHKFYENLLSEGYGADKIGDENTFFRLFNDSSQLFTLYDKLLKEGYTKNNLGTKNEFLKTLFITPYDAFEESLSNNKHLVLRMTDKDGFSYYAKQIPLSNFTIIRRPNNSIEKMILDVKDPTIIKERKDDSIYDWQVSLK